MTARQTALSLLCEYESSGKYVNLSLASHHLDSLRGEERGFLTALLYTSVERKITYDYYITAISQRSIDKIDPTTLNILRLGMCQICDMDSVPDHAAVNLTVELGRNKGEKNFVNGVLRQAIRLKAKGELPLPKKEKSIARFYSVYYSYPLWLVKHFISIFGEDDTAALLECFNTVRYTDLTVNLTKISVDDYVALLRENGYSPTKNINSELSVRLAGSVNPALLPGFGEGLFFIQDSASAISAAALEIQRGQSVIDVCSCPGGKSFAAAVNMGGEGKVASFDVHESKLSLVEDGAARLGLSCIEVALCDATSANAALFDSFDRVICDVPCSGLGVLGKKPDIRHRDNNSLQELPELQYKILKESAKYLKDEGILLYSTCTLNPAENEDVVKRFIAENDGYSLVDFTVGSLNSNGGMLTLLPHLHHTDGFFIAKIKKD